MLVGIQIYNLDIARIKNQRNEIILLLFKKVNKVQHLISTPTDAHT
jgi:hypothetical protein